MRSYNLFLFLFIAFSSLTAFSQSNSFVVESEFQPLSYEELYMLSQMNQRAAMIEAYQTQFKKKEFSKWLDEAIESYHNDLYNSCIRYTEYALKTGFYNGYIYYLRGLAYERLHDFKNAKKEYKKGKKAGSSDAEFMLEDIKDREKSWKEYQKSLK